MKKLFNKNKINKGFTLIETLVAITILMISVVGPLTIAQKSFMAAITARDQVIASYLAQDLMEQLKNQRDNALINSKTFANWIYVTPSVSGLSSDANCQNTATKCTVYIKPDGTYTNESDPSDSYGLSKFTRWAYYTKNIAGGTGGTPNSDHEVKVTVIVKWNVGKVVNSTKLENNFYDVTL